MKLVKERIHRKFDWMWRDSLRCEIKDKILNKQIDFKFLNDYHGVLSLRNLLLPYNQIKEKQLEDIINEK